MGSLVALRHTGTLSLDENGNPELQFLVKTPARFVEKKGEASTRGKREKEAVRT